MLRDTDAVATPAVKDLGAAARFYEETVGLSRAGTEADEAIVFKSGGTTINVYRSSLAGTNKATALTWTVDDVEDVVRRLKASEARL
jgi:extradiol dioxygenase family protein